MVEHVLFLLHGQEMNFAACMLLVWCVLPAEAFAVSSGGAATCFFAIPVSAVAHADVVPDLLLGASHVVLGP